jgi:hypothetical protein
VKTYDENLFGTSLFFDTECLAKQSAAYQHTANGFSMLFLDSYRFEGVASMYLYALITILCNFASPCPSSKTPTGSLIAAFWSTGLLVQIVSTIMGTVMLGYSSASFALLYTTCSLEMSHGFSLINVLLTMASPFHPAILSMGTGVMVCYKLMITQKWLETNK